LDWLPSVPPGWAIAPCLHRVANRGAWPPAACGKITAPYALCSLAAANPGGRVHCRMVNPEQVTRPAPTVNDPFTIHVMGELYGDSRGFDFAVITIESGA